jgi:hypothetical protein
MHEAAVRNLVTLPASLKPTYPGLPLVACTAPTAGAVLEPVIARYRAIVTDLRIMVRALFVQRITLTRVI